MRFNTAKASVIIASSILVFSSCKKDDNEIPPYTVPDTYNFDNVSNNEAVARVSMWAGLTSYLGKSTSRQLSQDTANYLWNNTNAAFTAETASNLPFIFSDLNTLSYNVAGKTADAFVFKALIDSMVKVSESVSATGSNGVPGKIGNRIFNYAGVEFNQLVAKGLMGGLQLNQVFAHLNAATTADNNTVNAGTGTAMQHEWDLAFGYVGIPKDYDSSIQYANTTADRPLAIGGYFRERGRYIQAGGKVYEAFLKGRAAIGAKDYVARNNASNTIKEYLEKTLAAAAYEYGNVGKSAGTVQDRFHGLSEGAGFLLALKYRQTNKLSDANYQKLLGIFNTSFWVLDADATHAKINEAQAILVAAYGQLQP